MYTELPADEQMNRQIDNIDIRREPRQDPTMPPLERLAAPEGADTWPERTCFRVAILTLRKIRGK